MDEINEILKTCRVFSLLNDDVRKTLLPSITKVSLNQNEILFYQGDTANAVYIVAQGKLGAELTSITGETKIIGQINPGETVGEVGALTQEPRSITIKALKETTLLKIPASVFSALCHQFPALMLATVQPIITRSNNLIQMLSKESDSKNIILIPAHDDINLTVLAEKLIQLAERHNKLLVFSDYQAEFANKQEAATVTKESIKQLARTKKSALRHLYILQSHDTPLARIAFKKVDRLFIVGDGNSKTAPRIDAHILDQIKSHRLYLQSEPELVLLYPEKTKAPINTAAWLSLMQFGMHHHIRMDQSKDFQRLMRFIRGKAVGVVLSGGGTRGWAHLGAIKALRDSKVPIDIIGGTSVGALVAACYASSQSYTETLEKFSNIATRSEHSISWKNLTWPTVSLFNAKNFTQSQEEVFQQLQIEDLWLSYFCISTNLSTSNEEILRSGTLWEKTRASSALPGIIPPMVLNGDIHMDGGLLNNLPVDVMRQFVGVRGKVIAIDLNSFAPNHKKYIFPPILTFIDLLKTKFKWGQTQYKFPRFIDTFFRGLFVGSFLKSKQNGTAANIYVCLQLNKFKLLASNKEQAAQLIEIGYQETLLKYLYDVNKKN